MSAVTPAQAAHDAYSGAQAYQFMMGNSPWETIAEAYRLIWRFAAWAAFEAARSPESYARPELQLGKCPLHPAQREVQVRSGGEWLCLRQFLDLHEEPQPQPAPQPAAVPRLRVDWARVSEAVADRERERDEARELLDHETRLTWQSGLPGERARVAGVRERAGLEAL